MALMSLFFALRIGKLLSISIEMGHNNNNTRKQNKQTAAVAPAQFKQCTSNSKYVVRCVRISQMYFMAVAV